MRAAATLADRGISAPTTVPLAARARTRALGRTPPLAGGAGAAARAGAGDRAPSSAGPVGTWLLAAPPALARAPRAPPSRRRLVTSALASALRGGCTNTTASDRERSNTCDHGAERLHLFFVLLRYKPHGHDMSGHETHMTVHDMTVHASPSPPSKAHDHGNNVAATLFGTGMGVGLILGVGGKKLHHYNMFIAVTPPKSTEKLPDALQPKVNTFTMPQFALHMFKLMLQHGKCTTQLKELRRLKKLQAAEDPLRSGIVDDAIGVVGSGTDYALCEMLVKNLPPDAELPHQLRLFAEKLFKNVNCNVYVQFLGKKEGPTYAEFQKMMDLLNQVFVGPSRRPVAFHDVTETSGGLEEAITNAPTDMKFVTSRLPSFLLPKPKKAMGHAGTPPAARPRRNSSLLSTPSAHQDDAGTMHAVAAAAAAAHSEAEGDAAAAHSQAEGDAKA